jgi:hypothetical protein
MKIYAKLSSAAPCALLVRLVLTGSRTSGDSRIKRLLSMAVTVFAVVLNRRRDGSLVQPERAAYVHPGEKSRVKPFLFAPVPNQQMDQISSIGFMGPIRKRVKTLGAWT